MAGAPALTLLLLVLLPAHQALATAARDAHGAEADTRGPALEGAAGRRHGPGLEEYGGGRIVDITHAYRPGMPPDATAGPLVRLKESMENGSDYNLSELRMHCHMGTHVDAPGHMNQAHFAAGLDVDTLDLGVLNGCSRAKHTPWTAAGRSRRGGAHPWWREVAPSSCSVARRFPAIRWPGPRIRWVAPPVVLWLRSLLEGRRPWLLMSSRTTSVFLQRGGDDAA